MASPSTEPTKTNQGEVPADPQQLLSDEASPPWYVVSALGAPEHAAEYDASFLIPLHHPDAEQRALGLGDVLGELEASIPVRDEEDVAENEVTSCLASGYVARVAEMSRRAPFEDVRVGVAAWLASLPRPLNSVDAQLCIGPASMFLAGIEAFAPARFETGSEIAAMYGREFSCAGRVAHLYQVLAWFPDYAARHSALMHAVTRESGPLPQDWRHFIALMAVALHDCYPVLEVQAEEFVACGGDPEWLARGLEAVPTKLAKLAKLVGIMVRKPWRLRRLHVAELVEGDEVWSIAELVHAITLIASFHGVASLVAGTGVTCEPDLCVGGHAQAPCTAAAAGPLAAPAADALGVVRQNIVSDMQSLASADELPGEQEDAFAKLDKNTGRLADHTPLVSEAAAVFVDPAVSQSKYEDFDEREKASRGDSHMLKMHAYSWAAQGYSLVSQYYAEAADMLDATFNLAFEMTDESVNDAQAVDTAPFRQAIWYYTHRLYGLYNDDHDYRASSALLKKGTKTYIKKVARFPEIVTIADLHRIEIELREDEKVHIAVLVAEARKQAELLRGLNAVMSYMMPDDESDDD
ncbi:sestrin-1 [Thecamonas trahens ATCC 50062]|uniref:Sestrin-1 n=1 Tax=Thecamonas trahens ATCC 50062 TaxID=461836 RepID=A0A0L0DDN5_THETB|nr:sestrin-1 [Thecamonas trahens ATCC 50062]KNC49423.1 sestrin-1 [Thecamonas trahens ATCC 50062]|eukprot:XP_013757846.1 sestrin-1 [Thecamonas trahens ATCC 50062]